MSAIVVWIDHEHAKIFELGQDAAKKVSLKKHEVRHHTHADEAKGKNSNKLFQDVAGAVKSATEILVLGPGQGKNHFVGFLKDHHAKDIAGHIVGVETVDHPTDNQILDYSRKFFKKFDLFH